MATEHGFIHIGENLGTIVINFGFGLFNSFLTIGGIMNWYNPGIGSLVIGLSGISLQVFLNWHSIKKRAGEVKTMLKSKFKKSTLKSDTK